MSYLYYEKWTKPGQLLRQRMNIENIGDFFIRTLGEIYWLGIHVDW